MIYYKYYSNEVNAVNRLAFQFTPCRQCLRCVLRHGQMQPEALLATMMRRIQQVHWIGQGPGASGPGHSLASKCGSYEAQAKLKRSSSLSRRLSRHPFEAGELHFNRFTLRRQCCVSFLATCSRPWCLHALAFRAKHHLFYPISYHHII